MIFPEKVRRYLTTTPATAEPLVEVCRQLSDRLPIFLDLREVPGMFARDCFLNVARHIKKKGGSVQHGWILWVDRLGTWVDAEFHVVWVDPTGDLVDITPKENGESRILFLPDPIREYHGQFEASIVFDLVGTRESKRQCEQRQLEGRIRSAADSRTRRPPARNDPCPCGSGKKYKSCHSLTGGLGKLVKKGQDQ